MALRSGFFNSYQHDRMYSAEDFNYMLDGLITDGVLETYGDGFTVSIYSDYLNPDTDTFKFRIKSGKAWFHHSWIINEESFDYMLKFDGATQVIAIGFLGFDRGVSFSYKKGPSGSTERPTWEDDDYQWFVPIAYIRRENGGTPWVDNAIGTAECPISTGILETCTAEDLFQNWDREFHEFMNDAIDEVADEAVDKIKADDSYAEVIESHIQPSVIQSIKEDEEFMSDLIDGTAESIESDQSFKQYLVNATETAVTQDTAFANSIVNATKTAVVSDQGFKGDVADDVKEELADDTQFKSAIVTDLSADDDFKRDVSVTLAARVEGKCLIFENYNGG